MMTKNEVVSFYLSLPEEDKEWAEEKARLLEDEQKKEKARIEKARLISSGVPEGFFNASFENFEARNEDERSLLEKGKKYSLLIKDSQSLLIYGIPCSGKTYFSCCILKEREGIYKKSFVLLDELNPIVSGNNFQKTIFQKKQELFATSLLVIDDVFTLSRSIYKERDTLSELIKVRKDKNLPCVLVTSLYPEDFISLFKGQGIESFYSSCILLEFKNKR